MVCCIRSKRASIGWGSISPESAPCGASVVLEMGRFPRQCLGTHIKVGWKKVLSSEHTSSSFISAVSMEMPNLELFSTHARAWIFSSLCVVLLFLYVVRRKRHTLPLPPGPKGLPMIGNVLDIPSKNQWLTYWKWGKLYGEYMSHLHRGDTLHLRDHRF